MTKCIIELQGGRFGGTIVESQNLAEAEEKARQWVKGLGWGDRAGFLGCSIVYEGGKQ